MRLLQILLFHVRKSNEVGLPTIMAKLRFDLSMAHNDDLCELKRGQSHRPVVELTRPLTSKQSAFPSLTLGEEKARRLLDTEYRSFTWITPL